MYHMYSSSAGGKDLSNDTQISDRLIGAWNMHARGLSMRTHLTAVSPEVVILGADKKERGF